MTNAPAITDWFASLYFQSTSAIAFVLDMARKNGEDLGELVIVLADLGDEATRFFVDQLARDGERRADPSAKSGASESARPGFVGAVPKLDVARVLRLVDAAAFAKELDLPVETGRMRVLALANGQMQCAEIPMLPPLSRGGTA